MKVIIFAVLRLWPITNLFVEWRSEGLIKVWWSKIHIFLLTYKIEGSCCSIVWFLLIISLCGDELRWWSWQKGWQASVARDISFQSGEDLQMMEKKEAKSVFIHGCWYMVDESVVVGSNELWVGSHVYGIDWGFTTLAFPSCQDDPKKGMKCDTF